MSLRRFSYRSMQFGESSSLARANDRRRERKGLEAIFSSQKPGKEKELFAGGAGIIAGLLLSILAIFRTGFSQVLGPFGDTVFSGLAFGAVGVLLLICGGGTVIFATARRESDKSNPVRSGHDNNSHVLEVFAAGTGTHGMFDSSSRTGVVAFVQSLLLLVLYSGFVQEFESNLTMQIWLQSNFPIGHSVLNWESVLILSVALGIVLLQFLPGRYFSE